MRKFKRKLLAHQKQDQPTFCLRRFQWKLILHKTFSLMLKDVINFHFAELTTWANKYYWPFWSNLTSVEKNKFGKNVVFIAPIKSTWELHLVTFFVIFRTSEKVKSENKAEEFRWGEPNVRRETINTLKGH